MAVAVSLSHMHSLLCRATSSAHSSAFIALLVCRYEQLQKLHQLWRGYVSGVVSGQAQPLAKLIQELDMHGADISVVRSADPRFADVTGIVARVTTNTFVIVDKDNKMHGENILGEHGFVTVGKCMHY